MNCLNFTLLTILTKGEMRGVTAMLKELQGSRVQEELNVVLGSMGGNCIKYWRNIYWGNRSEAKSGRLGIVARQWRWAELPAWTQCVSSSWRFLKKAEKSLGGNLKLEVDPDDNRDPFHHLLKSEMQWFIFHHNTVESSDSSVNWIWNMQVLQCSGL